MAPRFIGEPITVEWDQTPLLEKKPRCPDRFIWGRETFEILGLLQEWRDYGRRGRSAVNMRPENLKRARVRGSWGVGRYFFQVQVRGGRVFDLYYDRAPGGPEGRKGSWTLFQEQTPAT